jgi:hypothetical protein
MTIATFLQPSPGSRAARCVGYRDLKLMADPAKAGILVKLSQKHAFGATVREREHE